MTSPSIFKSKTYIDVWDGDLNRFVSEHYGRPWSMQQGMELSNESYVTIDVSHEGPDYHTLEEAEAKLEAWKNSPVPEGWKEEMDFIRDNYVPVEIILWDLCRRGIAPEGEYLIRVWW